MDEILRTFVVDQALIAGNSDHIKYRLFSRRLCCSI